MKNALSLLALSVISITSLSAQTSRPPQASDSRTRNIYVGVVNSKGEAVTGLTVADFTVREDGVTREVVRVTPATDPLDVVLLVDDSQAATTAIPFLRDGLNKFIDQLQGKASIGIVTIGGPPTSVAERTTDVTALKKGVSRIFARAGTGAYLLEGLSDVSRGLLKREPTRPVIVAISIDGIEFSNQPWQHVLEQLYATGAALHVLSVGGPAAGGPAAMASDEVRNKNMVVAEGTANTGGRRDQLLNEMAIPETLTRLAGELLNQYVVTYGRPEALIPPKKVQVSVKKSGLTVHAPTRLSAR